MAIAERLNQMLDEQGLTHTELARRVGVAQPTIFKLASGRSRTSRFLPNIARELGTTPDFLTGMTDDPDANAPPPPAPARHQMVMMPVALPSEPVLARMFEGLLAASPRMQGAELAHELARRLPGALGLARGAVEVRERDQAAPDREAPEDQPDAQPERRRA